MKPPPDWLSELQARFSAVVRTPLDRSSGTLRAAIEKYPRAALQDVSPGPMTSREERLSVYNRQYWFRLFTVLQKELPLTTALLGFWNFNELASEFLLSHPPRHYDLFHVAEGFDGFLEATLPATGFELGKRRVPRRALVEAACIDLAYTRVFMAPAEPVLVLKPEDAASLPRSRFVMRSSVALVDETWPLFALRRELSTQSSAQACALPDPHAHGKVSWALQRTDRGYGLIRLEPLQALLLRSLCETPLSEALAQLEAHCPEDERAELGHSAQRWLADSMRRGFWRERVVVS